MFLKYGTLCKGNKIGSAQDLRELLNVQTVIPLSIPHRFPILITLFPHTWILTGSHPLEYILYFPVFLNIANYSTEGSRLKVVD